MREIELIDLIKELPSGKKRKYFNEIYLISLINYFDDYTDISPSIDNLILDDFYNIAEKNKNLIDDLILFSNNLKTIIDNKKLKSKIEIKNFLYNYFDVKIITGNKEKDKYLLKQKEVEYGLHDFQDKIRRKVINQIFEGKKRFLIHMPTGSGKTRTACEIVLDFIRISSSYSLLSDRINVLWIAQSEELCVQAFKEFNNLYSLKGVCPLTYGHFYGGNEIDDTVLEKTSIVFCSIQKLLKNFENDLWRRIKTQNYLVVIDEAHRSIASQWIKALNFFVKNTTTYVLGLTATPGIGNKEKIEKNFNLSSFYENNKIGVMNNNYEEIGTPIKHLTERRFLASIKRIDIESKVSITDKIRSNGDRLEFKTETLKKLSINSSRNATIINIIKENNDKKILVFTCGVGHSMALREILNFHKIYSDVIDQGTENREYVINEFKNGRLNVLLNFGVLIAGFDAPKTNICIIARPVESIVMYSQMVGRILRGPNNGLGNEENTLFTIKDNLNHGDYDDLFNSFNEFWEL